MLFPFPSNWKLFILNIRTLHIFYDVRKRHTRFLFVQQILKLPAEHDRLIRFVLLHIFFFFHFKRMVVESTRLGKFLLLLCRVFHFNWIAIAMNPMILLMRIVVMPYSSQSVISSTLRCALRNRIYGFASAVNELRANRSWFMFSLHHFITISNGQPNAIIIYFYDAMRRSCFVRMRLMMISMHCPIFVESRLAAVGGRQLHEP